MADEESSLKIATLEEKAGEVTKDTFREIMGLSESSRPSEIYLHNAPQDILTKIVVDLGLMFKDYNERTGQDIDIPIFTSTPHNGEYGIDVGSYLRD